VSLSAGRHWYIDMTGHKIRTSMFKNRTVYLGKKVNVSYTGYKYIGNNTYVRTKYVDTHNYYKRITYQLVAKLYDGSPLVLDINRDGIIDTAKNDWLPHAPTFYSDYAKYFDITGDGAKDKTEWIARGSRDALLVKPEAGDVDTALQLFGTAGGYADGFEKLAIVCDKDNNGWIEGEEMEGLYLWFDDNNNAICEKDELKPLSDFNIKKLSTKHENYVGSYVTNDGKEQTMWDWWPCIMEIRMIIN